MNASFGRTLALSGLLLIAIVGFSTSAQAADGCGGTNSGGGSMIDPFFTYYSQGYAKQHFTPVPPYFSLHPPVYYSDSVPRAYGYSPYAYPPGVMTPEVVLPGPTTIQNQFIPRESETSLKKPKVAAHRPLRITNPFVIPSGGPQAQVEMTAGK